MKRFSLIIALWAGSLLPATAQSPARDQGGLASAYAKLNGNSSSAESQRAYFQAFPQNWSDYMQAFGYNKAAPGQNLYRAAGDYVQAFGHLKDVPKAEYYKKLIGITYNGYWEADAPNYLKGLVTEALDNDTDAFLAVLSKQTRAEQMLFWQYVWQNPVKHQNLTQRYQKLKEKMNGSYPEEAKTMTTAYDYFFGEMPGLSVR